MGEISFVEEEEKNEKLPDSFETYVKDWFWDNFEELTPPQKYSFDLIHNNKNSLICAPTGSGKTLGAFLSMLNELFLLGDKGELEDRIYVLYVSPLRALNNDIERNLREPLQGIKEKAEEEGLEMPEVRAEVRTGDTPQSQRSKQLKNPPHILITTPETLGILLDSPKFKEKLKEVNYLITDEIHSLCDNKRGVHLSLSIERLQEMAKEVKDEEFTRIGLSATQAPIKEIANYLVGYDNPEEKEPRDCKILDVAAMKKMDLKVLSPVKDLIHTSPEVIGDQSYRRIHSLIQDHETTLIFTNTRAGTERVVHNLKERYPDHYDENIGAHHSSMSRETRLEVEESLKKGELKVVVTSTSLELGIDIGYVDLVMQIGSPKGVARAIQRIGRSGHRLHDIAKGRVMVMDRDDALECSVMMKCAKEDQLDRVKIPRNCLDVMAQHIVGMGCNKKWKVDHAYDVIRKSYNYVNLDREDYMETLKYVAGEYAELEDQKVYGKIWLGEDEDEPGTQAFGRRGKMTRVIYMTNIGTIPDESAFKVYTRGDKDYVGTLDEEFLDRLTKGDIFVLGGSTFEFNYARGMKVYVTPRPESKPTVPSWYSEMLPLSYDLGKEIGKFNQKVETQLKMGAEEDDIVQWILQNYYLDEKTAYSLFSYIKEQYKFLKYVPTDEKILIEKTLDDNYRQNIIFHTIYGRKVNEALARIFAEILTRKARGNVAIVVDDHGFVLITSPGHIEASDLIEEITQIDLEEVLKKAVRKTELMKRRFRHVAARALMIIRNYKGRKKSVGKQQMQSHFLLSACEKIDKEFPIIKETYREIMEDAMDLEHAREVVKGFESGRIEYEERVTEVPSPFAHNLVIQGESDVVMMEDKKKRLQNLHNQVMERIQGS